MCDECDRPAKKHADGQISRGISAKTAPAAGISRRTILLAGAGVAVGAMGGFWSCQSNPPSPAQKAAPANPSSAGAPHPISNPAAAATGESISTASAPTTAASAPEPQSANPADTEPAIQTAGAPDLGSAVFPDADGKPIASASDAPVIVVPRSDWTTARPNLKQIAVMNGIARITIHHTAGEIDTDAWNPTAGTLESIREFHSGTGPEDRHWADIAYHFAVDRAGRVWQARPLAYQGAHVRGHNEHNAGIVLLGNFEVQSPAAAQLISLERFIGFMRTLYKIPLDQVFTHGELGMTSCPGKSLQAFMDRTRNQWRAQAQNPLSTG